jgi:hypothetical protein
MSVFSGTLPSVSQREALWGREEACDRLAELLRTPRNVVIYGVQGVGKASLLHSYLSEEVRRSALVQQKRLYHFAADFPEDCTSERVLDWFRDQALEAVEDIRRLATGASWFSADADEEQGEEQLLLRCYRGLTDGLNSLKERMGTSLTFEQVLGELAASGIHLSLVMEHFQTFTLSQAVTQSHLDTLRVSTVGGRLSLIVSNDYTFDRLAATQKTGGSALIHTFTGNDLFLRGWDQNQTKGYLCRCLGPEQEPLVKVIARQVYRLSGGIPPLVRYVADGFVTAVEQNPERQEQLKDDTALAQLAAEVEQTALQQSGHYFKQWCKQLTYEQATVLERYGQCKSVADLVRLGEEKKETSAELLARGLLVKKEKQRPSGQMIGYLSPNSALFKSYLATAQLAEECQQQAVAQVEALAQQEQLTSEDMRGILESSKFADQEYQRLWDLYEEDNSTIPAELCALHDTEQQLFEECTPTTREFLFQAMMNEKYMLPLEQDAARSRDLPMDYSAYGIRYCKALEQLLMDYVRPVLEDCFANDPHIDHGNGALGYYIFILQHQPNRYTLQDCADEDGYPRFNRDWWTELFGMIQVVNPPRIRNAHSPSYSLNDLNRFTSVLLGEDGLLARCVALRDWAEEIDG